MNHDPFVGKVIDGRYEIQARVGEGGMGVVYKSRQISIDRVIALKMLNAQMAADPTWVQRFYNEAKACSRLQHPNTIRMFDFGQTSDGRLFMTMEFLDGMSLRDALAKGPLTPQRVVKIMIQCCASLAEAHSIGIIHRDIKPDNVFLLNMAGSPDFVKLLDFSVAKLLEGDRMKTQAGVVFGTPQYMSPEQGRGLPLDARSDLYALGILAYEMLTGNVPFHDENPMIVIQMHQQAQLPPMPDSIPYSVQQIVRRVLEKDPGRRYQSAGEMMQHCQQVFAEVSQSGMSVGAGGMPKTMVAGGGPPMAQVAPAQQQQHYSASPAQKTVVAQAGGAPYGQQMQPGHMQPGHMQPGGMQPGQPMGGLQQQYPQQASANQKTIVAGVNSPMMNPMNPGQPMGMNAPMQGLPPGAPTMRPGMQQSPFAHGQMPHGGHGPGHGHGQGMGGPGMGGPGDGPARTVAIQPSEGVVSLTGRESSAPVSAPQGASGLFWFLSLVTGIGIGVLAYVIVLQVM